MAHWYGLTFDKYFGQLFQSPLEWRLVRVYLCPSALGCKVSDKKGFVRTLIYGDLKCWWFLSFCVWHHGELSSWTMDRLSYLFQLYYLNSLQRCFDIFHSSLVRSWCRKSNNEHTSSTELFLQSFSFQNFFLHFCHSYNDGILLRRSENKAPWDMFRISFFIKQIKLVFYINVFQMRKLLTHITRCLFNIKWEKKDERRC